MFKIPELSFNLRSTHARTRTESKDVDLTWTDVWTSFIISNRILYMVSEVVRADDAEV